MIVCPNCNHPNPDGAVQCEACYTPLPATTTCPSCGTTVQADAAFCGQCGFNLHSSPVNLAAAAVPTAVVATVAPEIVAEVPPLVIPDPLLEPVEADPGSALPPTVVTSPLQPEPLRTIVPEIQTPPVPDPEPVTPLTPITPAAVVAKTQLQQVLARLFHVQGELELELPQNLAVIHIGKANDRIPPDIDVSGFPNSEIVSRIHADIRVEGDAYFIEDVGSSNGTYINNLPLLPGNRHRLRPGDRISLGKGDLVTFLFQIS